MNYADIKQFDVANGLGIRVSIFVSGCTHHCKGCFNEVAWDFDYGNPFTEEEIQHILNYLEPDYVSGLSVLGGEPFEISNQKGLLPLLREVKKNYPSKNIWCFTGYLFEDILDIMRPKWQETNEMLSYIDILVDGPFMEELKDLSLRFKGSSNQRIIEVKASIEQKKIVLWDESQ